MFGEDIKSSAPLVSQIMGIDGAKLILCLTGRPVNGDSTRLKVADSTSENESLRRQIEAMSERIRVLEDALHVETSAKRSEPHPLLSDTLLSIKKGKWVEPVEHAEQDEEITRAFGTMAISEGKNIRYLGASATENQLLLVNIPPR